MEEVSSIITTLSKTRNAYIVYDINAKTIIEQNSQANAFVVAFDKNNVENSTRLNSIMTIKYYFDNAYEALCKSGVAYLSIFCSENNGDFYDAGMEIGFIDKEQTKIFVIVTPIRENRIEIAKQSDEHDKYFKVMQRVSSDIIFKVNLETKVLIAQGEPIDKFQMPGQIKDFPSSILNDDLIHVDDKINMMKFADDMYNHKDAAVQVRFKTRQSGYVWFQFESKIDEQVFKNEAVGKIFNIAKTKKQSAQLDELRELNNADDAIIACAAELYGGSKSINKILRILVAFFESDFAYIVKKEFMTEDTRLSYHFALDDDSVNNIDRNALDIEDFVPVMSKTANSEHVYIDEKQIVSMQNKTVDSLFIDDEKRNILFTPLIIDNEFMGVLGVNNIKKNQKYFKLATTVLGFITTTLEAEYGKQKLDTLVNYDALTGLMTERKFIAEAEIMINGHADKNYSLVSIDLDNFKYINEIYGYDKGTEIITVLAKRIKSYTGGLVARSFADNFLLLYDGDRIETIVKARKDGKNTVFEDMNKILHEEYNFSFSIGVYKVEDKTIPITNMIDSAIIARNIGKRIAGDTVNYYTEAMSSEREINNQIVATMHNGIENNEFVVYYQPKIDIYENKLVGAEALVRWFRDGKMIPPSDFVPVFEKNGFIERLDYYVLETVCKFITSTGAENLPKISVNLSGITLMNDNLVDNVIDIIKKYNINPHQLELEITESAFVDIYEKNIIKLDKLRNFGIAISMDDFGTGVSSLNRLNDIPLDVLKIDRSFIMKSTLSEKGRSIIKTIISLAKDLKLECVAEGVEIAEEAELLKLLGCNIIQGYHYSRPLPEAEFIEYKNNRKDLDSKK